MTVVDIGVRLERAPRRMSVEQANAELKRLRSLTPLGTRYATMDADGVKEELSRRAD